MSLRSSLKLPPGPSAGIIVISLLALPGAGTATEPDDRPVDLFRFDETFDLERAKVQDARISLSGAGEQPALRVQTGTRARWPGVTLPAPGGTWDLSRRAFLAIELANLGRHEVELRCRVDNPGANGSENCVTEALKLSPGESGQVTVTLRPRRIEREPVEFIGLRGDPPVSPRLDSRRVSGLVFFVVQPEEEHVFEIRRVRAGGHRPVVPAIPPDELFPMIDELGQYVHADWPGKTHSPEELKASVAREERDLETHPGPADRTVFGGWKGGPRLEASGFFRVEKHAGKWWLVDPEGRLFWSHGLDCVHASAWTPIRNREHYFRELPGEGSPFARFYGRASWAPHGYYKDHSPYRTYDFFPANLLRKYGNDWKEEFASRTHRRLRSWGFNTIANWSDREIYLRRKTPYVATISIRGPKIEGSTGHWGKFHDVFDEGFARSLHERLERERGASAGDPWCIGYFVDNELGWGDELSLAVAALRSPASQAAKRTFVADLREKYETIHRLNEAWGVTHASWQALLESRTPPDEDLAREDLAAFYTRTAETYFRTIRDALREVAPRQLYLGCRFAWVNDRAARAAARYCDVVSYNRYAYDVSEPLLPDGIDLPTIIGEFHFGALDRGMFHTGLRKARDQAHRAELYRDYVTGALRNPSIVGTHWFQYKDQATTGRGDGENYQIGFLDICDRPYPEIVEAARQVGKRMYELRLERD